MASTPKVRPVPNHEPTYGELHAPDPLRQFDRVIQIVTMALVVSLLVAVAMLYSMSKADRQQISEQVKSQYSVMALLQKEMTSVKAAVSMGMGEDIIFLKTLVLNPRIKTPLAREIAKSVHTNSIRFNRDPDLVLSIIEVESNFNPNAVSTAGAVGIMQVMPKWRDILGLEGDLNDLETNVRHGLQIFAFYEETHGGDLDLTLSSYNRGPGRVHADMRKGADPNRNGYAAKVTKVYNRLKTFGR